MTKMRPAMAEALRLTRAGKLGAATRLIQSTLSASPQRHGMARSDASAASAETMLRGLSAAPLALPAPGTKRQPDTRPKAQPKPGKAARSPVAPGIGSFVEHEPAGQAGALGYALYLPARPSRGLPLVVMLHGCSQTPADFARGTGMNRLAEELGFIVVYPSQPVSANIARCWNWFKPGDQKRDTGEPGQIAALTRQIVAEHGADASRVYVAGLSAGGAAAAILASAYPDVYAAVGIHSGLACGAATDMMSALSAMREGSRQTKHGNRTGRFVPVITFHGDSDSTVHAINSTHIVAHAAGQADRPLTITQDRGDKLAGRTYTRARHSTADGDVQIEQWTVHGAGHAWSGGNAAGSYTDASGPDASRAMVAFFLSHSLSVSAAEPGVSG
ncbi:alpha/beta hydrolase family esterase [Sphingomonas ursincola]|uniref:extracellular catalytic domain type 1 short-chain-length polyhydroxyalkanoate depolymerase n=1 Tax=Sphingomonas ursincola TaxID=56361 RepID=UPI0023528DA9|nr:PHB depolymerase family esterase [Sphingomonas ursincola]MBY0618540.1 PHB depolymerase family esterase [Sphingomonas ursincola]